jgi:putative transposase
MSEYEQHFCADRGYDYDDIRSLVSLCGYVAHILGRDQERIQRQEPGFRVRRWVCERTHRWMNRFRRLLIRWEKKLENYAAFLHLACTTIVWRSCPVFG